MKGIWMILALCSALSAFAQEPHYVGHDSADSLLLAATRKQMTNLVWEGRLDSVMAMQENFERNHPQMKVVASSERLLLYFWSERYEDVFRYLQQNNEDTLSFDGDEGLWNVLLYKTSEHINDLYDWIDQSALYDDEIQFLRDLLADLTKEDEYATLQTTDKKIATYREAVPQDAVYKTTSSEREYGFGFGLEAGPVSFSGDITRYFKPKAYGSLNFDLMMNRWDVAFMLQFTATSLQRDVLAKDSVTLWEKGATADFVNVGLTLGYAVVKNKWFRLSPYAGLMVNTISPTETAIQKDTNLKKIQIVSFGQCFGIHSQVRICQIQEGNLVFTTRFQYVPAAYNHSEIRYQGNFWSVMFGLCFYGFSSF